MSDELPWVALTDVFRMYGYTVIESARNAVAQGKFPVPTYKLGRNIVVDRAVHDEFFRQHREAGLRALKNNILLSEQQDGEKNG